MKAIDKSIVMITATRNTVTIINRNIIKNSNPRMVREAIIRELTTQIKGQILIARQVTDKNAITGIKTNAALLKQEDMANAKTIAGKARVADMSALMWSGEVRVKPYKVSAGVKTQVGKMNAGTVKVAGRIEIPADKADKVSVIKADRVNAANRNAVLTGKAGRVSVIQALKTTVLQDLNSAQAPEGSRTTDLKETLLMGKDKTDLSTETEKDRNFKTSSVRIKMAGSFSTKMTRNHKEQDFLPSKGTLAAILVKTRRISKLEKTTSGVNSIKNENFRTL